MKWLLTLALVVIVGTTGFKLLPVYIENKTVMTIAEDLVSDGNLKNQPRRQLKSEIESRFAAHNLSHLDPEEVFSFQRDANGGLIVDVKYEQRRKLLYNLEIVAAFDDQISE